MTDPIFSNLMAELEENVSKEELQDMADANLKTLKQIFIEAGYDPEYMFEFGMPSMWEEKFWSYPEYVIALFNFLNKKYSLSVPNANLDCIFDE